MRLRLILAGSLATAMVAAWWGYSSVPIIATEDPVEIAQAQAEYEEYEVYLISSTPFEVYTSAAVGLDHLTFVSFDLIGDTPMEMPDIWDVPDIYGNRVLSFIIDENHEIVDVHLVTPFKYVYGQQVTTWDPTGLNLDEGTVYSVLQSLRHGDTVPDAVHTSTDAAASAGFAETYALAFDRLNAAWTSAHPNENFLSSYPFSDCRKNNCNCKCGTYQGSVLKFNCTQWVDRPPSSSSACKETCATACIFAPNNKLKALCVTACRQIVCRDPGWRFCATAICNICAN